MRLPTQKQKLSSLGNSTLIFAIRERRSAIRYHRDQKMDDRCWLDDWGLWELLDDSPVHEYQIPSFEEGMRACTSFFTHRRADAPDAHHPKSIADPKQWDRDLLSMHHAELLQTLVQLQSSIKTHRDVKGLRTLEHDRVLYAVLPEKWGADFRLPPESHFLGEAKAPRAGCPSFWRSHKSCPGAHDWHKWGPCK